MISGIPLLQLKTDTYTTEQQETWLLRGSRNMRVLFILTISNYQRQCYGTDYTGGSIQ
jgi:hypothetical protein